ncbi:MAG: hypothetical protein NVS3B20_07430 [Polyangiales bacterium]
MVRLEDGTFRLFYAAGNAIGEATSTDGVSFVREETNPVIRPSAQVDAATLGVGAKLPFDDLAVDDPCVDRVHTQADRVLYRVMYTGRDRRNGSAIGFAGRYRDVGTFERHQGSVFGEKVRANAPAIARFSSFALLYGNQDQSVGEPRLDPLKQGIGVAITPLRVRLPMMSDE